MRREVQVEGHLTADGGGIVGELQEFASEGGDGSFCRDGHVVELRGAIDGRYQKKEL